jgi:hypothetical protein
MKRFAEEILRIAKVLLRIELSFSRDEKKINDINKIHREIVNLVDRIRQNENLETFINRTDNDENMNLEIGISDHEAIDAIVREIIELAEKQAGKYNIKMKKVK